MCRCINENVRGFLGGAVGILHQIYYTAPNRKLSRGRLKGHTADIFRLLSQASYSSEHRTNSVSTCWVSRYTCTSDAVFSMSQKLSCHVQHQQEAMSHDTYNKLRSAVPERSTFARRKIEGARSRAGKIIYQMAP